jgi:predicted permease
MYSVLVLTFEAKQQNENQIKQAIINIIKNPIILAIGAGLIGSIINFYDYCPVIVTKTIHNLAVMASPLALITIGAAFEGKKALAKLKPTIIASTIKLMILPAIFLPIAVAMGFHDEKMVALLVMLGAPTTVSCYIMAKSMDNDEVLTSSIIVMTTLMSSVTLTFWIYLLKSFGYV